TARLVEAARRIDEAEHAVLHQIPELDRVRHRGGHAARERFHERKARGYPGTLTGDERLTLHRRLLWVSPGRPPEAASEGGQGHPEGNGGAAAEANKQRRSGVWGICP